MKRSLAYDPGRLPTIATPKAGEHIEFTVFGLPPFKDISFSIRNSKHKHHKRFVALRAAAIESMAGRAWSHDPIGLDIDVFAPNLEPSRVLLDYVGGIQDTLDGSHGTDFTYLPIAYNDDCQICDGSSRFHRSEEERYTVRISFLANKPLQPTESAGESAVRPGPSR